MFYLTFLQFSPYFHCNTDKTIRKKEEDKGGVHCLGEGGGGDHPIKALKLVLTKYQTNKTMMNTQLHYFSKYHNIYLWHFTRYQWPFWICRLIKNQMVIKIVSMDSLTLKTMVQTKEFHLYDDKLLTYSHFHVTAAILDAILKIMHFRLSDFLDFQYVILDIKYYRNPLKKKHFCSNFGGFNCKLTRLYGIITTYRRHFGFLD